MLRRTVLNTATQEDRILSENPCRIRGADQEYHEERPILTVDQVYELADGMRYPRFQSLILVTVFCSLRWGEVTALRRQDIESDGSALHVRVAHVEVRGQGIVVSPPKSRAGVRSVAIPSAIRDRLLNHLDSYVREAPDSLVFTGPQGAALRRGNFNKMVDWVTLVAKLGLQGTHFHDLRHTGNHFAARAGASTKELMARMGHDDWRAAVHYQHATTEADEQIAERMSGLVTAHREQRSSGMAHGVGASEGACAGHLLGS